MKKLFYFCRGILYPLACCMVPVKVMDKEKYRRMECGYMSVCNHLSWMDIAYQMFWLPGYKRMLSKKENAGGKLQRWFLHQMGVIFVDRDKPELSVMRECIESLKSGEQMMIYPEGTRNKVNRELMPFHTGAAMFALRGNASVVPVAVHHKGKAFKRNYLGVGDPIEFDDLRGKRLDEAVLEELTARFKAGVQKVKDKLDIWVENKGWKQDKKEKRLAKKKLKKQYKLAKKEAKRTAAVQS